MLLSREPPTFLARQGGRRTKGKKFPTGKWEPSLSMCPEALLEPSVIWEPEGRGRARCLSNGESELGYKAIKLWLLAIKLLSLQWGI